MISNSLDPPSVFFILFNFFIFFNFGTNHEENLLFKYFSQKLTFTDFGKVSQRGYQTLIIKGRIKFTMNSFNLQSFSAQLSVWETMMILTRQPGQTISLSMLLFVISGTWEYRSGIEMINVTFCGMLLFLNLAEKLFRKNYRIILEMAWKMKIDNSSKKKRIADFLFNNWLTTSPTIWYPGSITPFPLFLNLPLHCPPAVLLKTSWE